jgi:hypothetical protein
MEYALNQGMLPSARAFASRRVFGLMRLSVPGDPFEPGAWLQSGVTYVAVAMNLVPFAGWRGIATQSQRTFRQSNRQEAAMEGGSRRAARA